MTGERVCIDGFNLAMAKGSGIATYGRNLAGVIRSLGCEAQVLFGPPTRPGGDNLLNEVALFDAPRPAPGDKGGKWRRWLRKPREAPPRAVRVTATGEVIGGLGGAAAAGAATAWSAFDVFHRANREHGRSGAFTTLDFGAEGEKPFELMHWTCPLPLAAAGTPNLYTIHDVVPLRLPYATLDNKGRFVSLCRAICRQADHVIAVSETTRRDVIRLFGIEESRITTTWQSVELPPVVTGRPEDEIAAEVEAVFGLSWRRYFLFWGAVEPKKNLARLIEAYLASGAADPLIIVGGRAWLEEGATGLLHEDLIGARVLADGTIRQADRIRRYDYLPITTLMGLVRGAKATLFPSLYEGFGLPVLESMMLGTPVLTSTAGALPEIAGEAALLVDPFDVTAIKRAIQSLDADGDLRDALADRGRLQAAKFSPDAHRARLAPILKDLL
ncbi:MAG: glycosyltransferase family 4 protein [Caulobacteraceae bacterium]